MISTHHAFLRDFRGWIIPQVQEQFHNGQMHIKLETEYIKWGLQSQQNIEMWWKSAFGGPNLEVFMGSQSLILRILWPFCVWSYHISIVLGSGSQINPQRTQKMWSGEENCIYDIWWKLLWFVQDIQTRLKLLKVAKEVS